MIISMMRLWVFSGIDWRYYIELVIIRITHVRASACQVTMTTFVTQQR